MTETLNLDAQPVAALLPVAAATCSSRATSASRAHTQQPVWDELTCRIPMTLKLVGAATVLSIVVGVAVGIVTALRQYSGFDYLVTFFTFVFFALPVFWVAVILKTSGGINFNDWLRDGAHFSTDVHRRRRRSSRR